MKKLLWLVIIILIVLGYLGLQRGWFTSSSDKIPTVCTLDAKLCPDGSSVGRVPPTCEFAACPGQ